MKKLNSFNWSVILTKEDEVFPLLAGEYSADTIVAFCHSGSSGMDVKIQLWKNHMIIGNYFIPTAGRKSSDPRKEVAKNIRKFAKSIFEKEEKEIKWLDKELRKIFPD